MNTEILTLSQIAGTNLKVGSQWYHVTDAGKWQPIAKPRTKQISVPTDTRKPIKMSWLNTSLLVCAVVLTCGILNSLHSAPAHHVIKHKKEVKHG